MTSRPPGWLAPGRAALAWGEGGPRASGFDDVYFSAADGLAEARLVFLEGCGLPQAWAGRERFVVGELGFGTGLNVLALWELWRRARSGAGWLHVVSVEGYPLTAQEAARAHAPWPELAALAGKLRARWPPAIKGVHRRRFEEDRLALTLACLSVGEALEALEFEADAWFLDGFAPARNPEMWAPDVLAQVARRSARGARLATFSVAGAVRRGLEAAGFAVARRPGFGAKRERLEAVYHGEAGGSARPAWLPRAAPAARGPALVIGAGLAGAAVAHAFAARGVEVTVLEAGSSPAQGASGNPYGLLMPRLDLDDRPPARLHRAAYGHAIDVLGEEAGFAPIGALALARDAEDGDRLTALAEARALPAEMAERLDAAKADMAAGVGLGRGGLWLAQAGLAAPAALVARWLSRARLVTGAEAASLAAEDGCWTARDADGSVLGQGALCIVCSGGSLARLAQTAWLPIRPSRGQITRAALTGPAPRTALAAGPYAAPTPDGGLVFGATYAPWTGAGWPLADAASDRSNLDALGGLAPALAARVDTGSLVGRAALRATTPDRLPFAGPVADAAAYRARFAGLAQGRRGDDAGGNVLLGGLFVLGGLGSRGLALAPLLAEHVSSEALGEPGALERGGAEAVHPARALWTSLKRGG